MAPWFQATVCHTLVYQGKAFANVQVGTQSNK